jgi:O-antigen ligase
VSRFRPSNSGLLPPRQPSPERFSTAVLPPEPPAVPVARPAVSNILGEWRPSSAQSIGFTFLWIYLIANLANDWSNRFFGNRAYFTLIAGILLPILCLASGLLFKGLKVPTGRWWVMYLVWMTLTVAFSTWRGGSFQVLSTFVQKNYPIYFYCTAFVLTIPQMRKLFVAMAAGAAVVVLSCIFFGDMSDGRLSIPGSIFFDNANDLALQLLIGAVFCLFFVFSKGWTPKVFGLAVMGASLIYMLKTGSRANFVSLSATVLVAFFLIRRKVVLAAAIVVVMALGAFTVSPTQLNRLVSIAFSPEQEKMNGDVESQIERTEMFKFSVRFTAANPVFGVGPGEFADQVWTTRKSEGRPGPSLGTHNTYTQVSSEMGIPGLIFYLGTLFSSFGLMLKLYKITKNRPDCQEIANLSFCLILILTLYSVSTIFAHVAYGRFMPTLAGMSVALWQAAGRVIPSPVQRTSPAA